MRLKQVLPSLGIVGKRSCHRPFKSVITGSESCRSHTFRGVAQLVAHLLWEQDVAGFESATPTSCSLWKNTGGHLSFSSGISIVSFGGSPLELGTEHPVSPSSSTGCYDQPRHLWNSRELVV